MLWVCAKAWGRTPWEVLHDPHLAYNMTVARAALELKRVLLERSEGTMSQRLLVME